VGIIDREKCGRKSAVEQSLQKNRGKKSAAKKM
jgi:hypothetical protein